MFNGLARLHDTTVFSGFGVWLLLLLGIGKRTCIGQHEDFDEGLMRLWIYMVGLVGNGQGVLGIPLLLSILLCRYGA